MKMQIDVIFFIKTFTLLVFSFVVDFVEFPFGTPFSVPLWLFISMASVLPGENCRKLSVNETIVAFFFWITVFTFIDHIHCNK